MSGDVGDNQKNKTAQAAQGVLFLTDVVGDDGRLRQRKGFEPVCIPLDWAYSFIASNNDTLIYAAEESFSLLESIKSAKKTSVKLAKINQDACRCPFYFKGESEGYIRFHPGDNLESFDQYGSTLSDWTLQEGTTTLNLDAEQAQALVMFRLMSKNEWQQGGQYSFSDIFMGELLRQVGASCGKEVGSSFHLVYCDADQKIRIAVGGGMLSMGDETPALDFCVEFILTQSIGNSKQFTLTSKKISIFADKKTGLKQKIEDFVLLSTCKNLSELHNFVYGKKRQATNPLNRFFGGLFGAIFGFLFAPVISLSMAIEYFDQHFSEDGLAYTLLTLLIELIWSVTLAPLQGLWYGLISCPDTGALSAFSPKAHFKNWLAYQLYLSDNPKTCVKDRQDLLNTHGRHNFVYTLLALTLLCSLSSFAIVFSGILPLPFFVSAGLGLMLIPIAPWSLGLAAMLPILVVGGIAILSYRSYQSYGDRPAAVKADQGFDTGQKVDAVAADQLPGNRKQSVYSPATTPESPSPKDATPFVSPAPSPDGSGSDAE